MGATTSNNNIYDAYIAQGLLIQSIKKTIHKDLNKPIHDHLKIALIREAFLLAELAIKLLLQDQGKQYKTIHNIKKLFEDLSRCNKTYVILQTCHCLKHIDSDEINILMLQEPYDDNNKIPTQKEEIFLEKLEQLAQDDPYVKLRYFEMKKNNIDYSFLNCLTSSLINLIHNNKNFNNYISNRFSNRFISNFFLPINEKIIGKISTMEIN